MRIHCSAVTHRGLKREKNEDCMLIFDRVIYDNEEAWFNQDTNADNFLFVVADGVGGSPGGDFASQFVLGYLSGFRNFDSKSLAEEIKNVHRKLLIENKKDPSKKHCATTIAGITYSPKEGILSFNVGDARVYRLINDKPECVSTDDNLYAALVRSGAIVEEKDALILSNLLTQSIGGNPLYDIEPHIVTIVPSNKERFLICTDGLYRVLGNQNMEIIISKYKKPDSILKKLLEKTLSSGAPDNIAAIFVEIEFSQKENTEKN